MCFYWIYDLTKQGSCIIWWGTSKKTFTNIQ